ncbi:hypothetical protein AQUCO_05000012v1 [Aquilegia coerulea]|uniref:Uncharacterized protein n=1 Tax=Aquilegia coerulea TaxID=218851 RepID=A0A2G5CJ59_AQUCA|nr:hypothetical protein AQUCO_05000012v1 [Aquilegia coerulea]
MEAGVGPKSDETSKKRKKKRVNKIQSGGVENNSKIDIQEEGNCIVEARIDDTCKIEDPAIDNLSNDKTCTI